MPHVFLANLSFLAFDLWRKVKFFEKSCLFGENLPSRFPVRTALNQHLRRASLCRTPCILLLHDIALVAIYTAIFWTEARLYAISVDRPADEHAVTIEYAASVAPSIPQKNLKHRWPE